MAHFAKLLQIIQSYSPALVAKSIPKIDWAMAHFAKLLQIITSHHRSESYGPALTGTKSIPKSTPGLWHILPSYSKLSSVMTPPRRLTAAALSVLLLRRQFNSCGVKRTNVGLCPWMSQVKANCTCKYLAV
jgi:hypothetical protein